MWPTLKPKDRVVLRPLLADAELPALGKILVCRHPHQPSRQVIKRLKTVENNRLTLLGDCPDASTDSRHWGSIPRDCLIGEVVAVVSAPSK